MFLGHTANWWGITLAVTSIVLTIPFAIFANIITPGIVNWLSRSTKSSLARRLTKLKKEFAETQENHPELSVIEDYTIQGILGILKLVCYEIQIGSAVCFLFASSIPSDSVNMVRKVFCISVAVVSYFVVWMWRRALVPKMEAFVRDRSPMRRESQRKAIAELQKIYDGWA
jgi:hypothetical protein